MKTCAIDAGVPSEDIFMDHAGFSTYESVYRAKEIFGAKKIVIVTQEYHLHRALYIANALGIEAYGVSADLRTYAGQTKRDVREVLARIKDMGYSLFKPQPTYLGEPISLDGSGDVTNDQ
jgi:vancomycin permeability regulator SanA